MIHINLPYENAPEYFHFWAHEEENIDFRKDLEKAKRCTLSYAAEELETYLNLIGLETKISDKLGDFTIVLDSNTGDAEGFLIEQEGTTLRIFGDGRTGGLYGAYELLDAQGIRWYSPWEKEYVPECVTKLNIPECKKYQFPMHLSRGFEFEGPLKESEELYIWMARNRLNLSGYRFNTAKLQKKLGLVFTVCGHFFHEVLDPKKRMPSGNTLLEDHPDWYGVSGKKLDYDNALSVQICTSNTGVLDYMADEVINYINGTWYDVDRIGLYGIDTWGGLCHCEACQKIGNGTDHALRILSHVRSRVDKAFAEGQIDHNVIFKTCAYEGTTTLEPPINGIPENLKHSGDYVVYAPILRCYDHQLSDEGCSHNKIYKETFEGWNGILVSVGEYYYVSRHEDLPLIFPTRMKEDLKYYAEQGAVGTSYLHIPMMEWGMRTLNQTVFAALCRDVNADVEQIKKKYYADLYGQFASEAEKAYDLVEQASFLCASWRQWCGKSIISNLMCWDGKPSSEPLYRDDHLGDDAVRIGRETVALFEQARDILRKCKKQADLDYAAKGNFKCGIPLNPTDISFKQEPNWISERLATDIRGLNYGMCVYTLMTDFLEYHDRLAKGDSADDLWDALQQHAEQSMESTFAVKYLHPKVEIKCVDHLGRSGLKDLYYRCLAGRKNSKK